jgi:hypothetical protein
MILTIYFGLLLLALIFIWTGFKIDNPVLEIGGFFFLFVLGLVLMSGGVQYVSGETYNYSLYNSTDVVKASSSISLTNFDADTSGELLGRFSINHLLGLLVAVFGGFGMAISTFNMKMSGRVD